MKAAAMGSLVAVGDDGLDAEQRGILDRPVARASGAVLLSGDHHQRRSLLLVPDSR